MAGHGSPAAAGLTRFRSILDGPRSTSSKAIVRDGSWSGTEPKDCLAANTCADKVIEQVGIETQFPGAGRDRDWIRRAQRGAGRLVARIGPGSPYFYNGAYAPYGRTWGHRRWHGLRPSAAPSCIPLPTPGRQRQRAVVRHPVAVRLGAIAAVPCPPASQSAGPSLEPSVSPPRCRHRRPRPPRPRRGPDPRANADATQAPRRRHRPRPPAPVLTARRRRPSIAA